MNISDNDWKPMLDEGLLSDGKIDVYKIELCAEDNVIEYYRSQLNAEEKVRANRFRFEKHQKRFILARGRLRCILSRYLNCTPKAVQFDYLQHGKPIMGIKHNSIPLQFNLSHSHTLAVCAVTWKHELGIDIEYLNHHCEYLDISKRFFSEKECEDLHSLNEEDVPRGFFNAWTRKEAFIKALGDGLSYSLQAFDVSLKPGQKAQLLRIADEALDSKAWSMEAFVPEDEYVCALAGAFFFEKIKYWKYESR